MSSLRAVFFKFKVNFFIYINHSLHHKFRFCFCPAVQLPYFIEESLSAAEHAIPLLNIFLESSNLEILVTFLQILCLCLFGLRGWFMWTLSVSPLPTIPSPPPPHIIISCIQIWIYRRQHCVCFKSKCHMADWRISGMFECMYVCKCVCVRSQNVRICFTLCLATSCICIWQTVHKYVYLWTVCQIPRVRRSLRRLLCGVAVLTCLKWQTFFFC